MSRRRFEVVVTLKPGLADPQGRTIEDALPAMGWNGVRDVRVGKHVELTVDAATDDEARGIVEEVARRLLSNPVIEEFRILSSEEALG
ncbi:MAG TPA: phosphoribosylformylglycinamidine synthase subunit PurS [Actinomycetota bacterium]|nr:phosphoribosylformylglycinamidine synthase subunit PurS [Actinomycetota bacterium]